MLVLWAALSFSSALVEISFIAALIFWFIFSRRYQTLKTLKLDWVILLPLLAYVGISVASFAWSENTALSLRGALKVLQQYMIFMIAADIFRSGWNLNWFYRVFTGTMFVLAVNGFHQYFVGEDFIRGFAYEDASSGARITGSFKSYGLLASYLVSTIPLLYVFVFWLVAKKKSYVKAIPFVLMLAACLTLLYWTRSRGAFLAFAAGTFFMLLVVRKFRMILALFVLAATTVFFMPKSMIIHLDAEGKEQSLIERYYLWDRAVSVIKAKPLQGTGINTYAESHVKYDSTGNWRVRNYYAHNGYLQMAAETGLPSLLCFLVFLGIYLKRSSRYALGGAEGLERYVILGLMAGITNFLILAAVDTVLHNAMPAMMLWYLLGIQWAVIRLHRTAAVPGTVRWGSDNQVDQKG